MWSEMLDDLPGVMYLVLSWVAPMVVLLFAIPIAKWLIEWVLDWWRGDFAPGGGRTGAAYRAQQSRIKARSGPTRREVKEFMSNKKKIRQFEEDQAALDHVRTWG